MLPEYPLSLLCPPLLHPAEPNTTTATIKDMIFKRTILRRSFIITELPREPLHLGKDRGANTPVFAAPQVAIISSNRGDLAVADHVDSVGCERVPAGTTIHVVSFAVFRVDVVVALITVHII